MDLCIDVLLKILVYHVILFRFYSYIVLVEANSKLHLGDFVIVEKIVTRLAGVY